MKLIQHGDFLARAPRRLVGPSIRFWWRNCLANLRLESQSAPIGRMVYTMPGLTDEVRRVVAVSPHPGNVLVWVATVAAVGVLPGQIMHYEIEFDIRNGRQIGGPGCIRLDRTL